MMDIMPVCLWVHEMKNNMNELEYYSTRKPLLIIFRGAVSSLGVRQFLFLIDIEKTIWIHSIKYI